MNNPKIFFFLLVGVAGVGFIFIKNKDNQTQPVVKLKKKYNKVDRGEKSTTEEAPQAIEQPSEISQATTQEIPSETPQVENPTIFQPISEMERDKMFLERSKEEFENKTAEDKLADVDDYLPILKPVLLEKYTEQSIASLIEDTKTWIKDPNKIPSNRTNEIKKFLDDWEMAKWKISKNPAGQKK